MEWDAKKASKGEWDMVINKMLEMVDCTIGRKVQDGRNVVVVFGTGEFESKKSRHTAFLKYFVNRVSSLGLRIVGVDEYFPSKKCPRCGLFVEMMTLRSLYCRGCHMYYHRDEMAGENTVNVVMEYVKSGDRPEYLQLARITKLAALDLGTQLGSRGEGNALKYNINNVASIADWSFVWINHVYKVSF
ncbi:hypothetical protein SeLEV6574_g02521 [Synchytrium endobioticum]|uniref:Cas12f1-like TNB domain-containing protein n=1 Tax=Synchytrium endobioticum TaxID=286115 RepID=A0A507D7Y6_9FUNG|nr:hypothetical protein SeLEV6574_g02521 [Synchytrium endobioticum]